jgi:hypothetical protein
MSIADYVKLIESELEIEKPNNVTKTAAELAGTLDSVWGDEKTLHETYLGQRIAEPLLTSDNGTTKEKTNYLTVKLYQLEKIKSEGGIV